MISIFTQTLILPFPIHPIKNPPTDIQIRKGKVSANIQIRIGNATRDPVADSMPPDHRCGSVVECLTRDRRAAGLSLTGVTALWSLSKTHLSQLSTGSTQEDPSRITERLLSGRKESNQTKT